MFPITYSPQSSLCDFGRHSKSPTQEKEKMSKEDTYITLQRTVQKRKYMEIVLMVFHWLKNKL